MRAIVATVVVALAMAAPARAQAQAEPDAKELFVQAERHFDLGEYEEAIAGYREAYRIDPRPGLLYNLGQAYRLLGDCVTAARMYRNFLRLAPESKYRAVAEENLASLEACEQERIAAGVKPATSEGSEPEAVVEDAPPPPPVEEPAPEPEVQPQPLPKGPARDVAGAHPWRPFGIGTAVAGAALAGVGAYLSVRAAQASREVSDAYREGAAWSDIEAIDARGRDQEVAGGVLLGVGSALAIAGVVVTWKF